MAWHTKINTIKMPGARGDDRIFFLVIAFRDLLAWQSARRSLLLASSAAARLSASGKCDHIPTGHSLDCYEYCVLKVVGAASDKTKGSGCVFTSKPLALSLYLTLSSYILQPINSQSRREGKGCHPQIFPASLFGSNSDR